MKTTDYPSDLTDAQFALIEPLLPRAKPGGRPRTTNLHDVVNAILYLNRTGCPWRALPKDYPPWSTVSDYYRAWRRAGVWQRVNDALRGRVRRRAGRPRSPRTARLDSQSVKAGGSGGASGFDGGKLVSGRKRHIAVDSLGLLLAVAVTAASARDAAVAEDLVTLVAGALGRVRTFIADAAYRSAALVAWLAGWGGRLLVIARPAGAKGWVRLPKRWVVERTFAWLLRYRRHSRDYERRTESSEAMIYISMIHLMARRLEPVSHRYAFRYRLAA
jgi:putative transposase